MGPAARLGLTASGIAAGYFACVLLSMTVRLPDGWAVVWPARAFLIAALMMLPPRKWWLIAAVVPVHFLAAMGFLPQAPLLAVMTQLLGHLAVALASVLAIRRIVPSGTPFDNAASLFKFIVVVGIAIPAAINLATIGVHVATDWFVDPWYSWWQWMAAGFFVTITIPPLLVLLAQGGFSGRPQTSTRLRQEIAIVAVALFATSFVAFGGAVDVGDWPAAYLAPLPLLLWAAVRFGVGGTALALLAMAGGIVVQAIRLHGPFAGQPVVEQIVSLHIFLAATSAPLMLLAALMDERRRAATLLRKSEERMQFAATATDTGLWQWDADPPRMWLTDNCRTIFGLPDEATSTPLDFLDAVHPEDQAMVGEVIGAALTNGETPPALEFRLCSGGTTRWFSLQMRTECDQVRKPAIVSGVFRDVTDLVEARHEVERLQERLALLRDDEHRRISEELHDSTAQHLVAANLSLLNLKQKLPENLHELLDDARRTLREAITELRTFTYLLHPSQLDEEGLCSMLRRYAPGFEHRTGISTSLRLNERADELPGEMQHALLRITQESLGNVQRHARATRGKVDLRCIAGNVHLIVRDDGRGICPNAGARLGERLRLGHGIPAMTARVRRLGGRIDVDARGTGTTVHVAIPLDASARGQIGAIGDRATSVLARAG